MQHGKQQWVQTAFQFATQKAQQVKDKAQQVKNQVEDNVHKYGLRQGVSYDTGIDGDKATRYNAIRQDILQGVLNPSINQLRKQWYCSQETATRYLQQLELEGHLIRNPTNNHYTVKPQN